MPPCRTRRPDAGQGAPRRRPWHARVRLIPPLVCALLCAPLVWCGHGGMALAQGAGAGVGAGVGDAPKPPTALVIRKGCAPEHARFCPHGQGGTRADIACLQQHHVDLTLGCRTLLGLAATPPAGVPQ